MGRHDGDALICDDYRAWLALFMMEEGRFPACAAAALPPLHMQNTATTRRHGIYFNLFIFAIASAAAGSSAECRRLFG